MSKYEIPELTTEELLIALEQAGVEAALSYKTRGEKMPVLVGNEIVLIDPDTVLESATKIAAE
ncbi:MAG: hypothetical protein AAFR74_07105 [Pseudomonadota bacterium]